MPAEKKAPEIETAHVAEVEIRVIRSANRERLLIGGKPMAFKKLPNGYLLEANFFVEPSKTLMAAAKDYIAQERGTKRRTKTRAN